MIVDFFVAQSEWAVMFAVYIQSMLNISIANVGYLVFFIVFAVNSKLRRKLWRFLVRAILVQCVGFPGYWSVPLLPPSDRTLQ